MKGDEILERVRRICLAFPEADEATLQDRPLFHVHRRRFAIFNTDHLVASDGSPVRPRARWAGSGCSVHFLTDPAERDALLADQRFSPSPHHGDRGWLAVGLTRTTDWAELAELLEAAYRTAAPRRLLEQLEELDAPASRGTTPSRRARH